MRVRAHVRVGVGIMAAGCLAAVAALAETSPNMHQHEPPSLVQAIPNTGIQYGAQPIPLESLQNPPAPGGGPAPSGPGTGGGKLGAPGGGAGGPGAGGASGSPSKAGGAAGGPPTPKGAPAPGGKAGPTPGGTPTPGGKAGPTPGGTATPGKGAPPGKPQIMAEGCEPHSPLPPGATATNVAFQQFPPSGEMKTGWQITFDHAVHRGLYITSAFYKPGPDREWIKVLGETGPGLLFVPYQTGQPRFDDMSPREIGGEFDFPMMQATQADRGRCGMIIGRNNSIIREVSEKGILWKFHVNAPKGGYTPYSYRGHKLTLWGTLKAGNYQYIFSYAFHDDGMIEFRTGATASNYPEFPWRAHMHNIVWRLNADLGGAPTNVHVMRHLENPKTERWLDCVSPFNGNREGGINWNPSEFTMLHIESAKLRNRRNLPVGYMVMPLYRGQARHFEQYMRNDAWVTRYKPEELYFRQIQRYANSEPINNNANHTLWVATSALHHARAEDGSYRRDPAGGTVFVGAAVAMWAGFDLKPFNLGDDTPFLQDLVPILSKLTPLPTQNPPALPACPN